MSIPECAFQLPEGEIVLPASFMPEITTLKIPYFPESRSFQSSYVVWYIWRQRSPSVCCVYDVFQTSALISRRGLDPDIETLLLWLGRPIKFVLVLKLLVGWHWLVRRFEGGFASELGDRWSSRCVLRYTSFLVGYEPFTWVKPARTRKRQKISANNGRLFFVLHTGIN